MSFKNANQRKFLFAMDKKKQQQGQLQTPGISPAPMAAPLAPQHMGIHQVPKLNAPVNQMNPIAAPSLPGLDKMPKFGKIRNSLKGQFKIK